MNAGRLEWLDLFRGLAAMVVVAYHFGWGLHVPPFEFGFLAVDLFFVLSGIVLGRRYRAAITSGLSLPAFMWQRLRRLYPMVLIVTVALLALNALRVPASSWSISSYDVILALPLLVPYSPTFGSGTAFSADSPMWSLWAELAANAVWFAALRVGDRFTRALFVLAGAGLVVAAFWVGSLNIGSQSGLGWLAAARVRALAGFGLGYAISIREPAPIAPAWLLMLLLAASCYLVQRHWLGVAAQLLVVLCGAALLVNLMRLPAPGGAVGRAFEWLGLLSYPLYMTHMLAARLALWVTSHGVRTFPAYLASFVLVAVAAALLNEAIVRRLPGRPVRAARRAGASGAARDPA
jgi:peptidoglycan/LPS O-acetylase OafA/YrhL